MQRQSGFTLIELMITVAIIAILAGIAVPSYTSYIIRGKLQEAHSNLLAMRTKMELYFQDTRTWAPAAPVTPPCQPGTIAPLPASLKYFQISCNTLSATTYVVQADGLPGTDLAGLTLTINEANVRRTVSVPSGWTLPSPNTCWTSKKGGAC
jgi:type IV pilus assembly protein PilE